MSNHEHNNEEIGFGGFLIVLCFFAVCWWIIKFVYDTKQTYDKSIQYDKDNVTIVSTKTVEFDAYVVSSTLTQLSNCYTHGKKHRVSCNQYDGFDIVLQRPTLDIIQVTFSVNTCPNAINLSKGQKVKFTITNTEFKTGRKTNTVFYDFCE